VSVANTAAKERKKNLKNVRFFFRDWRREERRRRRKKKKRMAFLRNAHIFLFFVRVRRGRRELLKVEKKKSRQQIGAGRENKRRTFPESYFHSEWMG
jgi:hypothetical protein